MDGVLTDLATAIDAVLAVDPAALTDTELHALVIGLQRQRHRLGAATAPPLAAWDKHRVWASNGALSAAARLANDTNCAPTTARIELRRARHVARMPATMAAIAEGRLTLDHLDLIGRADQAWRDADFRTSEARLADDSTRMRFPDAVAMVTYWCNHADAVAGEERARHQRDNAHLYASKTLDGNVVLDGLLDPVSGEIFTTELQRLEHEIYLADQKAGVTRRTSQRNMAALVEMATRSATMPQNGRRPRPLFIAHMGDGTTAHLCRLASGAVVTPGTLAPFVDDAMLQSVLFDGRTTVLSVSNQRRFTDALRTAVRSRDLHCQHTSGCDRPAHECDLDHTVARADHGPTTQFNLRAECPPHNRDPVKHDHDAEPLPWRAVSNLDALRGRLRWRYLRELADQEHRPPGAA